MKSNLLKILGVSGACTLLMYSIAFAEKSDNSVEMVSSESGSAGTATAAGNVTTADITALNNKIEAMQQSSSSDTLVYVAIGLSVVAIVVAIIAILGKKTTNNPRPTNDIKHSSEEIKELKRKFAEMSDKIVRLEQQRVTATQISMPSVSKRTEAVTTSGIRNPMNTVSSTSVTATASVSMATTDTVGKANAFINDYNSVAGVRVTGAQKRNAKRDFMRKYSVVGFSCSNGNAVVTEKATPKYLTTTSDPEFYAYRIDVSTYAVVPALWFGWEDAQLRMFGVDKMFSVNCNGDKNYSNVSIREAALFSVNGDSWSLKKAGRADFTE